MDAETLINELRRLTPDAIRARLAEIDAEAHALRLLLRAAIRAEHAADTRQAVPRGQ